MSVCYPFTKTKNYVVSGESRRSLDITAVKVTIDLSDEGMRNITTKFSEC
jgi:hypothetical protein